MSTIPVNKLFIDSRRRTSDSASICDIKVDLPESITLPENTVFFVDDVSISHAWRTTETGFSDKVYVRMTYDGTGHSAVVILDAGNYDAATLAHQIATKLNDTFQGNGVTSTCAYGATTGN